MAEDSRGGRNRRRYFRRKGGDKAQGAPAGPVQEQPSPSMPGGRDEGANLDRRARPPRRKRRGRNRRGGETRVDGPGLSPGVERDIDYQPPGSVYIYTHIVHPAAGGAYEFRSEHFSKVGRTLDDYNIDIDSLFVPPDNEARRRLMEQVYADWDTSDYDPAPSFEPPTATETSAPRFDARELDATEAFSPTAENAGEPASPIDEASAGAPDPDHIDTEDSASGAL